MPRKVEHPLLSAVSAKDDLAKVCATPEGRRVLWRIVTSAGVWARNPAATINLTAQWFEGRRDIGVELLEAMDAVDRSIVPLMMQEAANAELVNERS